MKLRLMLLLCAALAAAAFAVSGASGGNGSTVLRGHFAGSNYFFIVDGTPTFYVFSCDEQRVQRPDGSATESAHCQLDAGQTPPTHAAQMDPDTSSFDWGSDFVFIGPTPPGFAGGNNTADFHGVLTPSGNVNISATYAAP